MRILILGIDGYIGYPLALHLLSKDYEVCGMDDMSRRRRVLHMGGESLTPIATFTQRDRYLRGHKNFIDYMSCFNLNSYYMIVSMIKELKPDTIVHLAEQPSAPWSMIDSAHAVQTQQDNVLGTLTLLWAIRNSNPNIHLVKLGTMGEYGTPNCDIPEGEIPMLCLNPFIGHDLAYAGEKCPMSGLPFPRSPGSFYHLSKVHDTHNIIFACKTWGLRSTDIMQGVVFGLRHNNHEVTKDITRITRFDYDQYFGTAINRFCAQAIVKHPLTVYGSGHQTRGFLPLKDSIRCLTIAIENPPEEGEYRTFNQFENIYSIINLAETVRRVAENLDLFIEIDNIDNPRVEQEDHYYNPTHVKLENLGYERSKDIDLEILKLLEDLYPYRNRVMSRVIMPTTTWR